MRTHRNSYRTATPHRIWGKPGVHRAGHDVRSFESLRLPGLNETAKYELPISFKSTRQPTIKIRKRDRERAERIRLAGGPKPCLRERAVALARGREVVRTRDLTDIGIPRCYLARMCDEGLLINVAYGIYRATDQKAA
ncbi:type IV toxin-antitoxin system AbiEi family antitoxin domain-containing protein [Mesorhizobium sp. M0488]|uniref:type IV toxin-antitoxin system AbiEi family antitoxin domain-containing protein n=1 Tax=unclassified Mesorhizobium TaxID=325217 RepID=UPI0033365E6E